MGSEDKALFIKRYLGYFFGDIRRNKRFTNSESVVLLHEAICEFAEAETDENASMVYRVLRDSCRVSKDTDILGLIELMHTYELRSSRIVESQRDHYVHSVNVFILGLCTYSGSDRFKECYRRNHPQSAFRSTEEDFLYTWGLAALFHDIGYPVEIAYNLIRRFLKVACCNPDSEIAPIPEFRALGDLTKSPGLDSLSLLSEKLSKSLNLDEDEVYRVLKGYEESMKTTGRVDHGFFSAMMVIKWMSPFISKDGNEAVLDSVVESADAILLHNFFNHTFSREPYSLKPLSPSDDPMAFLLILCDELQEWNRTAYGIRTGLVYPSSSRVIIADDKLEVIYRTASIMMSAEFPKKKKELFARLLDIEEVFPKGLEIVCTCDRSTQLFLEGLADMPGNVPEFFANRIEDVARAIHNNYNMQRKLEKPDEELEYPDWEGLRDDLKLSNLKQAYGYAEKLSKIGCVMSAYDLDAERVESFTDDEIEMLSIQEHDRWVKERESSGWVYGPVKDKDNRISPYICPWDAVPEPIKEYDREAVRGIIPVLDSINIQVYRVG